jgi:hypothetical protein
MLAPPLRVGSHNLRFFKFALFLSKMNYFISSLYCIEFLVANYRVVFFFVSFVGCSLATQTIVVVIVGYLRF